MKRLLLTLVLVGLMVTPASATNFVDVFRNDDLMVSIDTDSVAPRDDYVVMWAKLIYRGKQSELFQKRTPNA